MSSNLRVNNILPSVGTNVAIGTAGGSITLTGGVTGSSITNTGVTTVSAGSTSAPSISPSEDSNTGIFFPSADTVAIAEGGAEVLRVNSSGNLGIGTNNPTTKLDVFVNGGEGLPSNVTGERMRIISNDVVGRSGFLSIIAGSSAYSGVFFGDKDAADVGKIRYYHTDNSLQFLVNGTTEAFRATSSGNLAFPSGQGIDFSATANSSGTMSSELLSDYEEGTWTPSTTGNDVPWSQQVGVYTKIGNLVSLSFWLQASGTSSGSGTFSITGIPYVIKTSNFRPAAAARVYGLQNFTGKTGVIAWSTNGSNEITVVATASGVAEATSLNKNIFTTGAEIHFTFTYQTN